MNPVEKNIRKRAKTLTALVRTMNDGIKKGSDFDLNLTDTEDTMKMTQDELVYLEETLDQANKYGPYVNLAWLGASAYLLTLIVRNVKNG